MTTRRGRAPVRLLRPLVDFLHTEAAGGIALVAAAALALVWANSPWQQSYTDLWQHELAIGGHRLDLTLQEWINEALMTIFFFVVGLEIKRELVEGELRQPRRAALPAIAAIGGMLVPTLIYTAFNAGGDGARGWGIPVATDIAMAVGVVSLLGAAVDPSLKLFLLALAIVDDIGAIVVIAVFYSQGIDGATALAALGVLAAIVGCRVAGVQSIAVYAVLGAGLWLAVEESGVHPTIAGVVLGRLTPTTPLRRTTRGRAVRAEGGGEVTVVDWLEHLLHPWSSFVVVPLFALANAGIAVSRDSLAAAWSSPITHGVFLGLVVGKLVGVAGATWLAVRLGVGALPPGTAWRGVLGIAALAGIGFTVSVFVTGLAFDDQARRDQAMIGILAASLTAAVVGALVSRRARGRVVAPAPPS